MKLERVVLRQIQMPLVAGMKTIVQPFLAFAALSLIVPGLDPMWRDVALMMAALPTASAPRRGRSSRARCRQSVCAR